MNKHLFESTRELPVQTGCEGTGFQREKSHWGEPDILSHVPLETSFDIKAAQGRGQEVEQEAVTKRLRRSPALLADVWGWGGKDWRSGPTAQEEHRRAFQASHQEANFIVHLARPQYPNTWSNINVPGKVC